MMLEPLWRKISQAYEMVANDNSKVITVEESTTRATIQAVDLGDGSQPIILVKVSEVAAPITPPTLIVP